MQTLKTALVGAGKVAHLHARALQALPESEFVGVCSRPSERLLDFADGYGVPAFTDVTEMIQKTGAQAICVCTPHPAHAAPTVAAASMGVHVLVEKPMASTLADCDAMMEAARKGGAVLGLVSQRRFYPACQRIRAALDAGRLGRPVLGTASIFGWRDEAYYRSDPWRGSWSGEGGGVLVNQSPHQLDLLLWYMGEVEEVFGLLGQSQPSLHRGGGHGRGRRPFQERGAWATSSSATARIRESMRASRFTVTNGASVGVQTDGGAMFIAGSTRIADAAFNDIWTIPGEEPMAARWKKEDAELFGSVDPMEHFHTLQVGDFLRSVLAGRAPSIGADDGRRTVELFTAIYRATRDGKAVRFPLAVE